MEQNETPSPVEGQESEIASQKALENYLKRYDLGYDEITSGHILEKLAAGEITEQDARQVLAELADWRHQESRTDELTGLLNRRGFGEESIKLLESLRHQTKREGAAQVIVLSVIDMTLKEINDNRGHAVGDQAIREVAQTIQRNIRYGDLAARRGGDEFVVLMPIIEEDSAEREITCAKIQERLRQELKVIFIELQSGEEKIPVPIKAAVGFSRVETEAIRTSTQTSTEILTGILQKAIAQADRAMFEDKRGKV